MGAQILTIVGVIVGALSSYIVGYQTERARHRRVLDTRWDERKLKMYAEYANVVKLTFRCAKQAARSQGDPATRADQMEKMKAAEDQRSLLYEDLVLLGSGAAVEAADDANGYLWAFLDLVLKQGPDPIEFDSDPRGVELIKALSKFHSCARADLGIPGPASSGRLPPSIDPASGTLRTSST